MTRFKALLKLHFKSALMGLGFAKGQNNKKKVSSAFVLACMGGLMLYIGTIYGFMLTSMAKGSAGFSFAFMVMLILTILMGVMLLTFSAQGVVFGNKDLDTLMSLPLPQIEILTSKILAVFLESIMMNLCIMLPTIIIIEVKGGFSLLTTLAFLVTVLLVSLFTTTLAIIVSFVLLFFKAKVFRGRLVNMLFSFVALGALMYLIFGLQLKLQSLMMKPDVAVTAIYNSVFPLKLLGEGLFEGKILSFLLFAVMVIAFCVVVVFLLSLCYHRLITDTLVVRTQNKGYDLSKTTTASCFSTLLKREFSRFFGTQILTFNAGFGLIMSLAAGVACLIFQDKLKPMLMQMFPAMPVSTVAPILIVCVLAFCASTCYYTAVSVSLEGKNLWIIKGLPISTEDLFTAKITANLILNVIPLTFSTLACCFVLKVDIISTILCLVMGLVFTLFFAVSGLVINLLFPRLDALSEVAIVKQSTSAIISMFLNMGVVGIFAFIAFTIINASNAMLIFLAVIALMSFLSLLCVMFIKTKGVKIFYSL